MRSRGNLLCQGTQVAEAATRATPPLKSSASGLTQGHELEPSMTRTRSFTLWLVALALLSIDREASAQILDKQKALKAQTFWDNRDWDWYSQNIPFFECPDADITTTYYYRWELLTKHLTYGSPNSGYGFTEFIDRPFWSGAYGAISCPAGHQLYEARWLRQPTVANDYLRYWFRTPGAQPRNYSTWLADSAWAVNQVHPDDESLVDLLPDFVKNYEGWEQRHFVPEVGLFWQTGHDDGMEFNINSRQTKDILRGAPSYRPSFNAYMWADAMAIARIADLADDATTEKRFRDKADSLKEKVQTLLWDPERKFFFPMYRDDEEREGHKVKARTLTYQSGQFAGDSHGRELIGYVPWQFGMLDNDKGYEVAWKKLMDRDGFLADRGPSTVERNDPMFLLQKSCCWWSGQSWPYATTQTLKGLANLLQADGDPKLLTKADYFQLLKTYAISHRKDGKPYLAEALHPDTGSFEGHDGYNHSEHYFHSGYCDLVITGLVGLLPVDDSRLIVRPLAPEDWDYFALDNLQYQRHSLAIFWDKTGTRYGHGAGLHVWVDGKVAASSPKLGHLEVKLTTVPLPENPSRETEVNFTVNNDGTYYPRVTASYTSPKTSISKLNDGNSWYLQHPPNRWTCEDSPNERDWVMVDFGVPRKIDAIKLYPIDDDGEANSLIRSPEKMEIEAWVGDRWQPIQPLGRPMSPPQGHLANVLRFEPLETNKLRVTLLHRSGSKSGLTEIEAWGAVQLPLEAAPPPAGNLAYNPQKTGFPQATASFTDRFGGSPASAIDGKTVFLPSPMNRWTCYESKTETDWLAIDFGKEIEFRRVELAIYDDRGGVQPPTTYSIEFWNGSDWTAVSQAQKAPAEPTGSQWNTIRFEPVKSSKARIVFTHRGPSKSGVSEVLIWND